MTDFSTLTISEVILHRIPAGTCTAENSDPIEYSEATVQLDARDRSFIERRLRDVLAGNSRPVIEDDEIEAESPAQVRRLLGTSDLVADSASLARRLHLKQKVISPPGLFMVIRGTLEKEACLVVTKIEPQDGMRMEPTIIKGKATFAAQYLRDLVFGERTRVYKVAVFRASGATEGSKLAGDVVDPQRGGGDVADFFVEFLGCRFVHRPDWQTQQFFKVAQKVISAVARLDPDTAADYQMALLSEIRSQADRISPEAFATHHLKAEHRDDFMARVTEAGVPRRDFSKDVSLIRNKVRRVQINTEGGATVLAPPAMWENGRVTIETSDGASRIVVTDKVSRVLGGNGTKATDNAAD